MPDTSVISKPADPEVLPSHGWKVILFNDELHEFLIVILAVQRAAGLSLEVAEMIVVEAHNEGSAVVRSGLTEDDAEIICAGLRKWTRMPGISNGVACQAEPDV